MASQSPCRNASEPIWPREECTPKAEPSLFGRRQHGLSQGTDALKHFGGVGRDSTVARSCRATGDSPRPDEKSAEQGNRITGNTGKSVDGERDSAGSVVARKRSNVCGAKRPCCL